MSASPFRNRKKERRYWRKAAAELAGTADRLQNTHPDIAVSMRKAAVSMGKFAAARRRKRNPSTII